MADYRVTLVLTTNSVERDWHFEGEPPGTGETIFVHATVSDPGGPERNTTRARVLHVDDGAKTITAVQLPG